MVSNNSWDNCRPFRIKLDPYGTCDGEAAGGWRMARAGYQYADRDTYYETTVCSPPSDYLGPRSSRWCSWSRARNQGSATAYIQSQLNKARESFGLGFAALAVDGILGARSDNAIRVYQQWAGLTPDGVVGRNTWDRLKVYI